MKKKLFFLFLLFLLFAIFVVVKLVFFRPDKDTGILKVESSPIASVFIDNNMVGKTPFEDRYKVGDYIIKLIPDGIATDTASWEGQVNVYHNATSYVNMDLGSNDMSTSGSIVTIKKIKDSPDAGQIKVQTEPEGAIVSFDSDEKGISPLMMKGVIPGEHEVSVSLQGFLRKSINIKAVKGYRIYLYIKMAIDETQQKELKESKKEKEASESAKTQEDKMVKIKNTPTGWLRVRSKPSITGEELTKVKPGETYKLVDSQNGWYEIEYEKDKTGWISGDYASLISSSK